MRNRWSSCLVLVAGVALAAPAVAAASPRAVARAKAPSAAAHKARGASKQRIRSLFQPGLRQLPSTPLVEIRGYGFAGEAEYVQLRDVTKELLRRYPPERHFFVGLGRDPTPIMAFLHNLGGDRLVMNLPASGSGSWTGRKWRPSATDLKKHLDRFIPAAVLKGDRDIVLVDQTQGGRTLRGLPPHLRHYLDDAGFKGRLIKVAFSSRKQSAGIDRIDTTPYPIVSSFLKPPYEGALSEYPYFMIGVHDLASLKPRPEYKLYRDALLKRMSRDPDLDRFIKRELASNSSR
jgi:hypothetical protein